MFRMGKVLRTRATSRKTEKRKKKNPEKSRAFSE